MPVAVNCAEVFTGSEDAAGAIAIEAKFTAALETLRLADPCTLLDTAVMVALPRLEPVARPAAVMLATVESEELHCAVLVTSFVVPSEKLAVAVNCCLALIPMDMVAGATCTEEMVGEPEVELLPLPVLQPIRVIRNTSPQQSAAFIRILQWLRAERD